MRSTVRKDNRFGRYMKVPIKILARARDFYVQSLTSCAGGVAYYGNNMGCSNPCPENYPISLRTNSPYNSNCSSRDEDMRELFRVAATRGLTGKSEAAMTRSRTVGFDRIDEDKPCEFGADDVGKRPVVYPRSRSYMTSRGSRMVRN
ncbi:hypothetical protein OROGR_018158 [Orobanche gracilis]